MPLVTVATFQDHHPAESLKQRMVGAGIPAEIFDEREVQRWWFLAKPITGVRVRVETGKWEEATRLSEDWDQADGVLNSAVRCPECGSTRVEYPQMTRFFLLPTLLAHLLAAVGAMKRKYYCKQCHCTWLPPMKAAGQEEAQF